MNKGMRHVPKILDCYLPYQAFGLAELRAAASHIALLAVFFAGVAAFRPRLSVTTACVAGSYVAGMFFLQRRIASGLPLRYRSLRHFRLSRDNFRRTSTFLRDLFQRRAASSTPDQSSPEGKSTDKIGRTAPVAVLTGGERGIGFEVLRQLVHQGFDVIICCPFEQPAQAAVARVLRGRQAAHVRYLHLNLADERSVRDCADKVKSLTTHVDLLINNAGIIASSSKGRQTNERDVELVLAINFLGPALFTELLLDCVTASAPSRIVNVSSLMHLDACVPKEYTPLTTMMENCSPHPWVNTQNYSLSKLLLICYTRDLARRLQGTDVTVAALHPGVVLTAIYDHWGVWAKLMHAIMRTVFKFPAEGAEVILYCAFADGIRSGGFYADCHSAEDVVSPLADDAHHNARVTMFVQDHFKLNTKETADRLSNKSMQTQ